MGYTVNNLVQTLADYDLTVLEEGKEIKNLRSKFNFVGSLSLSMYMPSSW